MKKKIEIKHDESFASASPSCRDVLVSVHVSRVVVYVYALTGQPQRPQTLESFFFPFFFFVDAWLN